MDDNVMHVLQMLQDGKVSAQEAETLIAALRGETVAGTETPKAKTAEKEKAESGAFFSGFDKIKPPKIDLDDLGERISKAVSKVQPEKIVQRVQSQIRAATRAGSHWGTTVSSRVKTWADGEDTRPTNSAHWPENSETSEQEFHLETGAAIYVENFFGNVKITGLAEDGPAVVAISKTVWQAREEDLIAAAARISVALSATDSRLDVKVSAPDFFRDGVVDLELRIPRSAVARVSAHFGNVEMAELEGRAEAVTTAGTLTLRDLGGDARGETASGELKLARILGAATVATQSGDISAEDIARGLSANTASGDVSAVRIEGGRVECKSVSGDVQVSDVGTLAPLDIVVESVSGDATLTNATGSIALKAVSGDAKAENISATRLQVQTVSGDVTARLRDVFSGTMQVNTVSGDVSLYLVEGSNVRVSLSTASGELRCEHDAHDVTATETLWTGQIGTGAGTLNAQTISGDTHIQRA